jgi:hypothetical protein
MAKFNKKAKTVSRSLHEREDATLNRAGGLAFTPDAETELYLRACAGIFEDKSYSNTSSEQHQKMRELVQKCDREFVLKLAAYVRNEMYLRSMPIALLGEAARLPNPNKDSLVRKFTPTIIRRADEPAEMLSYLWGGSDRAKNKSGVKLPNSIRKGLCDALENFDEYQLQKHDKSNASLKLRDLIKILHPKPKTDERSDLYKRAMTGELKTANTWETYISTNGSTAENWNTISKDMGVMALLRNLRNFEQKGAKEALQYALNQIRDPEVVRKSKQLPFRWYTAERQVSESMTKDALREAIELSVVNLPKWGGETAIFVDLSGSMEMQISAKSVLSYKDIACVMGSLACFLTESQYLVGAFGESYKTVPLSRRDSVLTNVRKIQNANVGHSTEAWKCINHLIANQIKMDRVFVFSDMQCYGSNGGWACHTQSLAEYWTKYKRNVAPDAILYSVDLAGHGTTQFPTDDSSVVQVSGWSDKIFQFVRSVENADDAVSLIKSVPVPQNRNLKDWQQSLRHNLYVAPNVVE